MIIIFCSLFIKFVVLILACVNVIACAMFIVNASNFYFFELNSSMFNENSMLNNCIDFRRKCSAL